jgi:hypothetical protein
MRPSFKLLTVAGLSLSAIAAGGALLAAQSPVRAGNLPEKTVSQIIRSSGKTQAPVREVRAVKPGRYADSCKTATWPYIPEECLIRGKPVHIRVLK